jgi:hypothetical protein
MASFTDKIPNFNPYVQQLPVDAMVQVGMEKQKRYDEGIQKIQSTIDQVGGLDLVRDVDKAYLQSKINELGNNVKTFMASDFSDFQLVNSVNGMTGQIVKDQNVMNAVNSTAKYRKEVSLMEEDRKKGTLTPQNEVYFSKQAKPWIDSSDVSQSFSGKYVQYFDVFKYAKETFDALKPDEYTFDQIFQTDSNGNPLTDSKGRPILSHYMKRLEKEGYFPEKVKATLNQIFSDPRVSRQLNIDGQYNLSGLGEPELKQKVELKRENDIIKYQEQILALRMKESITKEDLSLEISNLEDNLDKINSSYDELLQTTNLDTLRGSLYRQDTFDKYTNMFGYTKSKETIHANEAFKMEFEINKTAQERADRLRTYNLEVAKFQEDKRQARLTDERERLKIQIEANKKGGPSAGNTLPGGEGIETTYDTTRNDLNMADYKYTTAANTMTGAQDKLIFKTMFAKDERAQAEVRKLMNNNENINEGQAITLYLKQVAAREKKEIGQFRTVYLREARKLKTNDKQISDLLREERVAQQNFKKEMAFKKERDEIEAKAIEEVGLTETFKNVKPETVTYRGKKITLSKQNQIDIATYIAGTLNLLPMGKGEGLMMAKNTAKRNLDKAGLGDLAERYLQETRHRKAFPLSAEYAVGFASSYASGLGDLFSSVQGDETTPISNESISKYYDIAKSIYEKSYDKVASKLSNTIRNQYSINPNKAWSLTTGDAETDKGILANLEKDYLVFTDQKSQNLASKDELENFGNALNEEGSKFSIRSTTDENGNPSFYVETRTKDGEIGKMYLNPDMARNYGYNTNDVFESDQVSYLRNSMNLYLGKTSIGDPSDASTYNSGVLDYAYDTPDFRNLRNPNYDVKVNIATNNGVYYPYVYITDGMKETIISLEGKSNLSQVNATILSTINDAFVQSALSKVK